MCIVYPCPLEGPAEFVCAQGGCRVCLDDLMGRHDGLVHHVLRRQFTGAGSYAEVLQEGRIALWQAILHFEPERGVAFSTYAGVAIQHRIWDAARRSVLRDAVWCGEVERDALEALEEQLWWGAVHEALVEAVARLPERLRQVVCAVYGLDGQAPCTQRAIGQRFGVSGEMARVWRNDALVLLRLPRYSARLRQVYGQDSRAAYARSQALTRAWLRGRRPRR
jgi:RNA polymerase sigma factor (sigma-70 family)